MHSIKQAPPRDHTLVLYVCDGHAHHDHTHRVVTSQVVNGAILIILGARPTFGDDVHLLRDPLQVDQLDPEEPREVVAHDQFGVVFLDGAVELQDLSPIAI